jgi:hypothetical protein
MKPTVKSIYHKCHKKGDTLSRSIFNSSLKYAETDGECVRTDAENIGSGEG